MNVARLRELMNDLPDDMPVVVRGGIAGYDPLITAAVRLLGPTPVHFENYDGVLIEEHLDYQTRRPHFALGLSEQRECMSRRLHEANIEGYWDPEDAAWGISGWLDERHDWLAEMRMQNNDGDKRDD